MSLPGAVSGPSGRTLALPDPARPRVRSSPPVLAATVPVLGALVLFLVTKSPYTLWLAALSPLVVLASLIDSRRAGRRERRVANREWETALSARKREIAEEHEKQRSRLWRLHPDLRALVREPSRIWRRSGEQFGAVVVGVGAVASSLTISGGGDHERARQLRARAAALTEAPVVRNAGEGIAIVGPRSVATSVARALLLQLCLSHAPGTLRVRAGDEEWVAALPHAWVPAHATVALVGPDASVPDQADMVIAVAPTGTPTPPACRTVLVLTGLTARLDDATRATTSEIRITGVAHTQAAFIARELARRAEPMYGSRPEFAAPVALGALQGVGHTGVDGSVRCVVGVAAGRQADPVTLDLVDDGPHAIVAGITGSGKSELLTTWIVSLAAGASPDAVTFLLADFKGGTAFDRLAGLPHVIGVITDLDGAGAERALSSLRAEIRWREAALGARGARDIAATDLPRLVIVIDEFAALLAGHPDLRELFADVAARGRALGIHLIIGTQRVTGVVSEAMLANCPLRIGLRLVDRTDSTVLLGTDAAAQLDGSASGTALIRRPREARAESVRIALCSPEDIAAVPAAPARNTPRAPWLPALSSQIALETLSATGRDVVVLGLADLPEHQDQRPFEFTGRGLAVFGGPGSGKTTLLNTVAFQCGSRPMHWLGSDAEYAWDVLTSGELDSGTVVVIDDCDALLSRYPPEYAAECADAIDRIAREATIDGVWLLISARQAHGVIGRIAGLLPHRAVLPLRSRADFLAVGGEGSYPGPEAPPGRARVDGVLVQLATTGVPPARHTFESSVPWQPAVGCGIVTRDTGSDSIHARTATAAGLSVVSVADAGAVGIDRDAIVMGDPGAWQRDWRLLERARERGLLIDAECVSDYRGITGDRRLPPFCSPGTHRGWWVSPGKSPRRVTIPR